MKWCRTCRVSEACAVELTAAQLAALASLPGDEIADVVVTRRALKASVGCFARGGACRFAHGSAAAS
jgi:hypothetical protein